MSVRKAVIPGVGTVMLYKRRRVKTIRLSITHDGKIRVTMPTWAPYKVGIDFVQNKADWIKSKTGTVDYLKTGDRIGKAHHLQFEHSPTALKVTTRVKGTEVRIHVPAHLDIEDLAVQAAARNACIRALKQEGEQLLPRRLANLAKQHGFEYSDIKVKRMRSRWGSCNHHKEIVLNCYLMQLPWHLIDYVILHELLHTEVLAHGKGFWSRLGGYVNDLPAVRKEIKAHQPALVAQTPLVRGNAEPQLIPVAVTS